MILIFVETPQEKLRIINSTEYCKLQRFTVISKQRPNYTQQYYELYEITFILKPVYDK